jgi:hypothetical protein
MKFYETHFEEYINSVSYMNLHPKMEKIYSQFPDKIMDLKNLIFYGPSGIGKYSQMLYSIKKYSPTDLKYEKKISLIFNKQNFYFKISDIHYEIDMSLLGCNPKLLWNDIYLQIVDIVSAKQEKSGIILCKNFHDIHSELLDNFYSYMQNNNTSSISLKFILVTEEISFIPENILNCCEVMHLARPCKTKYAKVFKKSYTKDVQIEDITNIKNIHCSLNTLMLPHKIICDKILEQLNNVDELKFLKFRDLLYDIFIYNLNITHCVWYILSSLITKNKIQKEHLPKILKKTYNFFKFYNNNYRPIYHLESYMYYIVKIIHDYP